jgi:hypothetical protein
MAVDLGAAEKKVYSQNGEDGIIATIFATIGTTNKFYVEFGVEDGTECNTRRLKEQGWGGIWMDSDGKEDDDPINKTKNRFYKQYIRADNILPLLSKYGAPKTMDFLSVDIDYNDLYVLHRILTKYKPRVICVEFNCHLRCRDAVVVYTNNYFWDRTNYYNAGIVPYQKLCDKFGYDLVYVDKNSVNLFFIDRKLGVGGRFANANKPHKLWRDCAFGITYARGKVINRHKDDYYGRKYVNFETATDPKTVPCLDRINCIISKSMNGPLRADVAEYIKLTKAGKFKQNAIVAARISRKICPLVKNDKYKQHVHTMAMNGLIMRYRTTDKKVFGGLARSLHTEPSNEFKCSYSERKRVAVVNKFIEYLNHTVESSSSTVRVFDVLKAYECGKSDRVTIKKHIQVKRTDMYDFGTRESGTVIYGDDPYDFIYENNANNRWLFYDLNLQNKSNAEIKAAGLSRSGAGSNLSNTGPVVSIVKKILSDRSIECLWDTACGDFLWMKQVVAQTGVKYIGTDRSKHIIKENCGNYGKTGLSFHHVSMAGDIRTIRQKLDGRTTLIIAREVIQHMTNADVVKFLSNVLTVPNCYLLCTNYINNKTCSNLLDIVTAGTNCRNLFLPPSKMPLTATYSENIYTNSQSNKFLSLWKVTNKKFTRVAE